MTTPRTSTGGRARFRVRLAAVGIIGAAFALTGAGHATAEPAPTALQASAAVECQSFWPVRFEVCGEILDLYRSLGGPGSTLLFPSGAEAPAGDGAGTRQVFLGGSVYYSPTTGAYIE